MSKLCAPALATVIDDEIRFEGLLCSIDGKQRILIEKTASLSAGHGSFGADCANEILQNGGGEVMEQIRNDLRK